MIVLRSFLQGFLFTTLIQKDVASGFVSIVVAPIISSNRIIVISHQNQHNILQQQQQQQLQDSTRITKTMKTKQFLKNHRSISSSSSVSLWAENGDNNNNKPPPPVRSSGLPIGSIILFVIATRSLVQLFLPTEIPGNFLVENDPPPIDYIGTAFDVFFVFYGAQTLLQQFGVLGDSNNSSSSNAVDDNNNKDASAVIRSALDGWEGRVTLNIGRESGTWMEKDWAVSGTRLLLPVRLGFSTERIDLGFPGEESLGGRFCSRLNVLNENGIVSFVGTEGQVNVPVSGGGWSILPLNNDGTCRIRFFLDFPNGCQRNDVVLPPRTRVFFGGACFENKNNVDSENANAAYSIVEVDQTGVGILSEGGLSIKKRPSITNFYGALGDTNLILGRYEIRAPATTTTTTTRS